LTHRLKGKVAIVTGSSRGLGRSIAIAFANQGAKVVINYNQNESAAIETQKEITKNNGESVIIKADVSKRVQIKKLINETFRNFKKIDILVNNAGINKRGYFEEIKDQDWDLIMNTNLKGPFICCQEIFPFMKKNKSGRIINISSVASKYHGPKTVHYAVSKAGLNSLTKILARYGAEHNILVNSVAPGLIYTDQTKEEFDSGAAEPLINMTLLKKPGSELDVISACLFLAEESQSYMTGQVLSVSGGAYLA
jgi:3-oxoacyl-[acyl-carrier protein] reductase